MKTAPTNQWTYSQNEEYWDNEFFPNEESVIEAGKEAYYGESFEIGQVYSVEFTEEQCTWFDLADKVIDNMIDALEDEVGEVAEYWTDQITYEDEKDLNERIGKTIMEWINERIGQPNVFSINNVKTITEYEEENGCY